MSKKFVIHSEWELLTRPMPQQLVDGLIVQNAIVMLVAKYGVGKSFVAVDLACSIVSGQSTFLGRPLRKSGPVVYVLAEGWGASNFGCWLGNMPTELWAARCPFIGQTTR